MDREEAKTITPEWVGDEWEMIGVADFEERIDKIYDDFESRLCINCKWGEPFADKAYSMVNCEINDEDYPYKYGCIDFERKTDNVLTYDKLQEMIKLIPPYVPIKERFFKKFFPNIKNIEDWYVAIPLTDDPKILEFIDENSEWAHIDKYAPQIIAMELGSAMRSWYD